MSGYIRKVKHTQEVDGQTVTITMSPLTIEDMLPMRSIPREDKDRYIAALLPLVVRHTESIEPPITDSEGVELAKSEILEAAYFMPLVINAGTELVKSAYPKNP